MISCSVSGKVVSNCHPMTASDQAGVSGACQAVADDGDGEPGDANGEIRGSSHAGDGDKDHDGTPDSMDQADDDDGVLT